MPNEEMGHRAMPQPPDVDSRWIFAVTLGFLVFVAISMTGLFFYLRADAPEARMGSKPARPKRSRTP